MHLVRFEPHVPSKAYIAHIPELFKVDPETARRLHGLDMLKSFRQSWFKKDFFANCESNCAWLAEHLGPTILEQAERSVQDYKEGLIQLEFVTVEELALLAKDKTCI